MSQAIRLDKECLRDIIAGETIYFGTVSIDFECQDKRRFPIDLTRGQLLFLQKLLKDKGAIHGDLQETINKLINDYIFQL